jgi:uncharacterized damage-inducible protein DinB
MIPFFIEMAVANKNSCLELVEALDRLPAPCLDAPVSSSFPSIRSTLLHIWEVEASWLSDLLGQPEPDFSVNLSTGPLNDVFKGMLQSANDFESYVKTLTLSNLEERVGYTRYDGVWENQRKCDIILHCMNHSTFHRGQVVAMAGILGFRDLR